MSALDDLRAGAIGNLLAQSDGSSVKHLGPYMVRQKELELQRQLMELQNNLHLQAAMHGDGVPGSLLDDMVRQGNVVTGNQELKLPAAPAPLDRCSYCDRKVRYGQVNCDGCGASE